LNVAFRHTSNGPQSAGLKEAILVNTDLEHIVSLPTTDVEYTFGKPKTYLTVHELARLTLLRSRLGETQRERAAEVLPSYASPCNPT